MRALYVSALALLLVAVSIFFVKNNNLAGVSVEPQVLAAVSTPIDQKESEIIDMVNEIRRGVGVEELVYSSDLKYLTMNRVIDMKTNKYYSHISPEGLTYVASIGNYVSGSTHSCENLQLQVGQDTSEVVTSWKNSPAHYRCLTDPKITRISISNTDHLSAYSHETKQNKQMYVFAMIASN